MIDPIPGLQRFLRRSSLVLGSVALLMLWSAVPPEAQAQVDVEGVNLTSQRLPARVSFGATYQRYEDEGQAVREWALPVSAFVPLTSKWSMGLSASRASVDADALDGLDGFDDVQVATTYATRVGASSLVASLAVNLPSGKRNLTVDEFQTSIVLSQNHYAFEVAGFGQGLNVAPSLTAAMPVGERVVLGAGVVYQWRGPYEPIDVLEGQYQPGHELGGIVGIEVRAGETLTFAADVSHTRYGTDKQVDLEGPADEMEILELGPRTTGRFQARSFVGFNELQFDVRADYYAESTDLASGASVQTLPTQVAGQVRYAARLSPVLRGWVLVGGRYYDAVERFRGVLVHPALTAEEKMIADVGLGASVRLGGGVRLLGRGIYSLGDLDGIEAGLGLSVSL